MNSIDGIANRWQAFLCLVTLVIAASMAIVAPATADTHRVKMGSDTGQLTFVPSTIEVSPGDTIKWRNNRLPPHNVVFYKVPSMSHKSLAFGIGDIIEARVPDRLPSGAYTYYCQPHRGAGMVGEMVVRSMEN